ncbi:type II toxin-antitoxin system prevent-host-death family antitoxin [Prauserella oleivorans]|uniref:Antitoxin n=1 Tax=Prauserella oleivorans TaxID=1478153 RepID=A0ABW5WLC3_9PSEU
MTSVEMPVSEARADFGGVTGRAEYGHEIVYLTKHGRRAAAVVPAEAAELLERIEELVDEHEASEVLARLKTGTEERVPFRRRTRRRED